MKAGLLGRKLGHSLSPQIHRFFGDYEYRLYEKEPEEVADFLRTVFADGDFGFLNVTIPYKQTVFELCDELTPMARKLGNVNFVTRTANGKLLGDNTDAFGVERLIDSVGADVKGQNCAILGAGGAAMTVRAVLEERGAKRVTFIRRGEEPASDDDLIVNATPVGMFPDVDGVRVNISQYVNAKAVLDLVYNPSPTRLVREARACGKTAADGLVMLIAQAWRAFQLVVGTEDGRQKTLFLYGPPASGKSTLAAEIAAATGWTLVDLDAEIVKAEGRTIPEIFAADGEPGFRAIEKRCLSSVCGDGGIPAPTGPTGASVPSLPCGDGGIPAPTGPTGAGVPSRPCEDGGIPAPTGPTGASVPSRPCGQVVALGGGALLNPECRAIAEQAGRIVVLDCPLETLKARPTGGDRPLSADTTKLEALVTSRAAHYASFPNHVEMV